MDSALLKEISSQIPSGIIVSFHRSGEPTAYPHLWYALNLFRDNITSLLTHGMNLVKKADEIISNCTIITVSVHKGDPDHDEQLNILNKFMELKYSCSPQIQIKIVGDMDYKEYEQLTFNNSQFGIVRIIHRSLHVPQGSYDYIKIKPTIPECGVCLDLLGKPSINWQGDVSICNRFDPKGLGIIGNISEHSLDFIWNDNYGIRKEILNTHIRGHRELIPACAQCDYWGCPTG